MVDQKNNRPDVDYEPGLLAVRPQPAPVVRPRSFMLYGLLASIAIIFVMTVCGLWFVRRELAKNSPDPDKTNTPTVILAVWNTPLPLTDTPEPLRQPTSTSTPTARATFPNPDSSSEPSPVPTPTLSDTDHNSDLIIFSGHAQDCSQQSQDILFIGTEEIKFTTCLSYYKGVSQLYLLANKPITQKENNPDSYWKIFETSISPVDSENTLNSTFHARVTISNKNYRYYGLDTNARDINGLVNPEATAANCQEKPTEA